MKVVNRQTLFATMAAIASLLLRALVPSGCKQPPAPAPATSPASKPATTTTAPATTRAASTEPGPPRTFVQLVRRIYPSCAVTQPLDVALDRKDGAHLVVRDPVYLDRFANLWITRADAEAAEPVLARAVKETEHFIRERPAYVHWRFEPGDRRHPGHSAAVLVCPAADGKTLEFIEETRRTKLTGQQGPYHWADAFSWNDESREYIVVASATGASLFTRAEEGWSELASPALVPAAPAPAGESAPHLPAQVPVAIDSLIAYVPADATHPGSKTIARFNAGKWSLIDDANRWPGNFLHLIPLADGSVLQLILDDEQKVRLAITDFSNTKVDRRHLLELLEQLNSKEHSKQDAAFKELATYGSGLWPVLEAEMENQPPVVREKMAELLKNKTDPTLGEMALVDSQVKLVARSMDGGCLLYSKGGVAVTNVDGDQTLAAPAWISVRSGQPIRLMLGEAWNNLTPNNKTFYPLGPGDWIVADEGHGPQELVGTFELTPILRKSEFQYSEFVGLDRHSRWLFREPAKPDGSRAPETLILDPTLPPVAPRLPVWDFMAAGGTVGCDDRDFPAYQDKGENVWVITGSGFKLLDKKANHYTTEAGALAKRTRTYGPHDDAPLAPTTNPSTRPTTNATLLEDNPPLLILDDGTRYYGGKTSITWKAPDGHTTEWPLPEQAQGSAEPWLVPDRDGRLFLFNEPGRLLRLSPTPDAAEPFKLDATFSHKIPNVELRRMWLDPAGRIVLAYADDHLAICFPEGIVPAQIADKIPAMERDEEEE